MSRAKYESVFRLVNHSRPNRWGSHDRSIFRGGLSYKDLRSSALSAYPFPAPPARYFGSLLLGFSPGEKTTMAAAQSKKRKARETCHHRNIWRQIRSCSCCWSDSDRLLLILISLRSVVGVVRCRWGFLRGVERGTDQRAGGGWILRGRGEGYPHADGDHHPRHSHSECARCVSSHGFDFHILRKMSDLKLLFLFASGSLFSRREGEKNQGVDVSSAEKVQVPGKWGGALRWKGQQQRSVRHRPGWIPAL